MAVHNNSNKQNNTKSTKWEQVYEDEETISIWKYDSNISTSGPIEVDLKYKKGYVHPLDRKKKTLGELAKDARKESKLKKSKS
jgi:homoserine trans-succinylase